MQTFIHYFLHFGFPLVIVRLFFKNDWKRAYIFFLGTMLVDLDHLVASPIFKPNRCSINFHFLHTFYAIAVYIGLLFLKRPYRYIGIGLLFHMITDFIDCLFMYNTCSSCLIDSPAYPYLKQVFNLL